MGHNSSGGMSVMGALGMARRRKLYLITPVVLLAAGSLAVPPRFRAKTLVAAVESRPANYVSARPDLSAATVQEQLRTIRETLLSDAVLEKVNREFNLYALDHGRLPDQAADDLRARIQIQVEGQDAFYVGFEGPDRLKVMQVANRLAELFIQRTSDTEGQRATEAGQFLDQEVSRLRQQLDTQEEGIRAYKQSAAQKLPERLDANLKFVQTLRLEIQSKTDHIDDSQARRLALMDELKALEKQGALAPPPAEKTPEQTALEDARLQLNQLKAKYTQEHPAIGEQEKVVRDLEARARSTVPARQAPSPVQLRYNSLKAELKSIDERIESDVRQRDNLAAELNRAEAATNATPSYQTSLEQRTRDSALTRAQYEALFARQQEARRTRRAEHAYGALLFKVVEPARVPVAPFIPHRVRLLLLGLLSGLAVGIGLVLLKEHLDTSFLTIDDLQNFVNLPVLSVIPTIPARPSARLFAGKGSDLTLVKRGGAVSMGEIQQFRKHRIAVVGDPESVPSEQYRILTHRIHRWMKQTGGQVLAVTSAAGGEGKSVTALNLSFALAALMPGRVVLVDADARRPRVHAYLGVEPTAGLSNLLAGTQADIGPCISKIRNLDIIPSGNGPHNLTGLEFDRVADIIATLRKQYRVIVVDGPPIVPTVDSHVIASMADAVLVVVRARQTQRELLRRSLQSLDEGTVLGTVLNDIDFRDSGYAYAYQYYQKQCLGAR